VKLFEGDWVLHLHLFNLDDSITTFCVCVWSKISVSIFKKESIKLCSNQRDLLRTEYSTPQDDFINLALFTLVKLSKICWQKKSLLV